MQILTLLLAVAPAGWDYNCFNIYLNLFLCRSLTHIVTPLGTKALTRQLQARPVYCFFSSVLALWRLDRRLWMQWVKENWKLLFMVMGKCVRWLEMGRGDAEMWVNAGESDISNWKLRKRCWQHMAERSWCKRSRNLSNRFICGVFWGCCGIPALPCVFTHRDTSKYEYYWLLVCDVV